MTRLIHSLSQISVDYDAVFCDLWGCLHDGQKPFATAVAALRAFRAQGGRVVLLTNAPRPMVAVEQHLAAMGVPPDVWDLIATSGDATQAAMLAGVVGTKVFFIGADKDEPFFTTFASDITGDAQIERTGMLDASGVICTGLADDLNETTDDYRATLLMAKTRGLPMLCANPDIVVDWGDKRLYCAGALAEDYANMGGEVLYYGKPHPPIYDLARRRLSQAFGIDEPRILCIGDGISTDVQGAMGEGLDCLFITGGIATHHFGDDPAHPDETRLQDWLVGQMQSPSYAMGLLG
jgi:HAD superfamily hydrolase (TIGR01459 family)